MEKMGGSVASAIALAHILSLKAYEVDYGESGSDAKDSSFSLMEWRPWYSGDRSSSSKGGRTLRGSAPGVSLVDTLTCLMEREIVQLAAKRWGFN